MKRSMMNLKSCSIREAISWGKDYLQEAKRPDSAIDAKLLMLHVLGWNQTKLLLEGGQSLKEPEKATYMALITKRAEGIPLQHLTHEQEFMGLTFYVDEHVLIPRQDTETLIERLLEESKKQPLGTGIDIGTGSGCIGISLAYYLKDLKMTLIDISKEALQVADHNVTMHKLKERIKLLESDRLEGYTGGKVDFIVSNPPYIAAKDMADLMIEVKDHEPHLALTDGKDGLYFYKSITHTAKDYLKSGGILAFEIGYDQGQSVMEIMTLEGYEDIRLYQDLAGKDRVIIGKYQK